MTPGDRLYRYSIGPDGSEVLDAVAFERPDLSSRPAGRTSWVVFPGDPNPVRVATADFARSEADAIRLYLATCDAKLARVADRKRVALARHARLTASPADPAPPPHPAGLRARVRSYVKSALVKVLEFVLGVGMMVVVGVVMYHCGVFADKRGDPMRLAAYDDHPPPVADALRRGRRVWQLRQLDYHVIRLGSTRREDWYVILAADGTAESVVKKDNFQWFAANRNRSPEAEYGTWATVEGPSVFASTGTGLWWKWTGPADGSAVRFMLRKDDTVTFQPDEPRTQYTVGDVLIREAVGDGGPTWSLRVTHSEVATAGSTQMSPPRTEDRVGVALLLPPPNTDAGKNPIPKK